MIMVLLIIILYIMIKKIDKKINYIKNNII